MIEMRTATRNELSEILAWAAAEGWNPGLDDAEAFFAADPAGFFVALDDGVPVAAISTVNHNDRFAFLGLYIVRPDYRGKGIGYKLWQFALDHAGARTVGLDGVPDQQSNYTASGFVHAGETVRFSGQISPKHGTHIRMAADVDIPALIKREAQASGASKPAYLTTWFQGAQTRKTYICEDGFCTVRACQDGAKIGPLWAKTIDVAEQLMRHAAYEFGETLFIDVPVSSTNLTQLCKDLALNPSFNTARMYRGVCDSAYDPLFAVVSLELG